jgi:regulator of protease activity HflC (stomatin/prohibitin superfamily)
MTTESWIVLILLLAFVFMMVALAIRIVPEYQRLVVLRLGRLLGVRGPGFILLIPVVDRGIRADLRETFFDVPPQSAITKDNAPVSIDFLVYMKIVDALPSVINVADFGGAARGIAITTLRAVVGDMVLDDVLSKRENINEVLRQKLDEVTNRWGIKVTAVEIREIKPPRDILEAMTKQMAAERQRRAMILQADGEKERITRVAEGDKRAVILRAEGDRQGEILRAEGYALALERIFSAAREVDSKTMSLQYLEMLKDLGSSESTKFVIPVEFTKMVEPFLKHNDPSTQDQKAASTEKKAA